MIPLTTKLEKSLFLALQVTATEQLEKLVMSAQLNYFRETMENHIHFGEYGWIHKQLYHDSLEDKTRARTTEIQNSFTATGHVGILAFKIEKLRFLCSAFIAGSVFYY